MVRRYLQPSSRVSTSAGGRRWFLALASHLGTGVGIDADPIMIQVAQENPPDPHTTGN